MALTISQVETIAVRAPLAREVRGSYYHMTTQATIEALDPGTGALLAAAS